MHRVVVVGTSGSGKSTFARSVAAKIGGQHIELDAIYHQANWEPLADDEFRSRVGDAAQSDVWVSDGNYSAVSDILWRRADTVVWLDYSRWLTTGRIVRRTVGRAVRREELWNANREDWRNMFRLDPKKNVILWSVSVFGRNRKKYEAMFASPDWADLAKHRLRSPREAEALLATIPLRLKP